MTHVPSVPFGLQLKIWLGLADVHEHNDYEKAFWQGANPSAASVLALRTLKLLASLAVGVLALWLVLGISPRTPRPLQGNLPRNYLLAVQVDDEIFRTQWRETRGQESFDTMFLRLNAWASGLLAQ